MNGNNKLKRLCKLSISLGFLCAWRVWSTVRGLVSGAHPGTCVVIYYHEVRPENRRLFARQMDILLRHAEPTRADRSEPLKNGAHYAAVTFDDGFLNVVENAVPELRTRNIPATLFMISDALGKYPDWLTESHSAAARQEIASEDQLRSLPSDLITIASHTMTHPRLPELAELDARRELLESRLRLEKATGSEVRLFSFPFGATDTKLFAWCREAGYQRVFTTSPTLAFTGGSEFVTGRVSVEPTDWPLEFRLKLMGAYQWLPAAYGLKSKARALVFGSPMTGRRAVADVR